MHIGVVPERGTDLELVKHSRRNSLSDTDASPTSSPPRAPAANPSKRIDEAARSALDSQSIDPTRRAVPSLVPNATNLGRTLSAA